MSQKKELTLKKSVGAIQSKPDAALTLLERKLFNICLFHAYNDLTAQEEHRIHIDSLHKYLGYKGNNWTKIDHAFDRLQSTKVAWNIFGQSTTTSELASWTRSQMIGVVKWSKETKEFIYTFSKELAKALYRPDQYAIIFLEIQQRFKSEHALVLYEQCIRYKTNLNGTRWFTIKDIRDLLVLDSKCYDEFKVLNNRVLKPAINEINNVSDVFVQMECKKQGRVVTAIKFFVIPKTEYKHLQVTDQQNSNDEQQHDIDDSLKQKIMADYKLKEEVAEDLINNYGKERILSAIQYVTERSKNRKKAIEKPAAYFVDTVKNNYKTDKQIADEERRAKQKIELELAAARNVLKAAEIEYEKYEEKFIYEVVAQLDVVEQKAFMEGYDKYIQMISPRSKYRSEIGLVELIHNRNFKAYAKTSLDKAYDSLISLGEYIKLHSPQAMRAMEFIEEAEYKFVDII